ncbi:ABC transporter permease [Paenibacillus elgii]|uniref:ABC transporter permease n=1 Tax=Paenibacillus elgii TaxID=189691 RepID=UPI000FDB9D6A|nr:ABC transporter permease [Paenibacillus elgii]NEN84307.1 ABC transporter permease [Paenibacillus elgii]
MTSVLRNLFNHRNLLFQFVQRDIVARYRGSYLGLVWTLVQPLVMLVVYSFVFSVIFKVKWGNAEGVSKLDFAMVTFAGLIIFQIFSEPMYRSTAILSANSNYVKKVVFPLEILPTSAVFSGIILNMFSMIILIATLFFYQYPVGWNLLLIPVLILPLTLFTLGFSYIVTTLGVFFKDLGQAMGIIMNILFYISPVFYPVTAVPKEFQIYMNLNPLTFFVESFRAITIYNTQPNWMNYIVMLIISLFLFFLGSTLFNKSKETFSDVI